MLPHDVVLIVDQYQRYREALQHHQKINPSREAQGLSMLINPFGRHNRRIAIVAEDDEKGLTAYQKAGYETIAVNGNRPTELRRFIRQMDQTLDTMPPKHLILVTTDPAFVFLCDHAVRNTNLSVWASSSNVPTELTEPTYNYRRLEELLPDLKTPKIDIRLDYENLHIGLKQMGWAPDPKTLIETVKAEITDLGDIVNIVAYADWSALSKSAGHDIQRELALLNVETRYQVNMRGKNSADMKIADDVRTLVEKDTNAPDTIDIIVLGTGDRDFRPTVDTVKSRGKQVIILALRDSLSSELQRVANEVRYLDERLAHLIQPGERSVNLKPFSTQANHAICLITWLRGKGWKWVYADKVNKLALSDPGGAECLRQALEAKFLVESKQSIKRPPHNHQIQVKVLVPDFKHPLIQAAHHLVEWVPARIGYCLREKGMPYVDSNYLIKGLQMDTAFKRLGVGTNWHEAEGWLDLAANVGLIVKKSQLHPEDEGRIITTWWLPEQAPKPSASTPGNQIDDITAYSHAATPITTDGQASDLQSPLNVESVNNHTIGNPTSSEQTEANEEINVESHEPLSFSPWKKLTAI